MTKEKVLAALESAPRGDRGLDFWVWWYGQSTESRSPNPEPPPADYVASSLMKNDSPDYTTSLDTATSLVRDDWFLVHLGEVVRPCIYRGDRAEPTGFFEAHLNNRDGAGSLTRGRARRLVLALCAAALRAAGPTPETL